MRLLRALMQLLFPPKCVLCGKLLKNQEQDLCAWCRTQGPLYPNRKRSAQFLDSFAAVWYYEGSVRRSLLRFKFRGAGSYAKSYGRLLAMELEKLHPEGFDLLTWVPISRRRRLTRGYDQVALLAKALGRELGMTPEPTLKKIRHNRPQSSVRGLAQRRANVLGAYRVMRPAQVAGKRVLLLDDILTTGATAGECARMLKTAGAKEIHCAAVAATRK
ncbi:MAG: ComF family protein [Eubacteriales bacterium]|nr:ComF family protein [Eubacteriales bacterium]